MQSVKNTFNNISPIRTINAMEDAKEVATHVIPEVAVQRVVSRMFGKSQQSLVDSALTHAMSVPFIGALAFMGPTYHPTLDADYSRQLQAGAAGIPAVLFARYLLELMGGAQLLHLPWDNVRDLLITAVSKAITRPALATIGGFLPQTIITGYDMLQQRFDGQSAFSPIGGTPGDLPGDHKQLFGSDIYGGVKKQGAAAGDYVAFKAGSGKGL